MTKTGLFKKSYFDPILLGILILGGLLLFALLDLKPPQHDEGVNGWFIEEVTRLGYYPYTPESYHGPLHYYLLLFFKILLGRNLWALRLPAVLFSFGSLFIITRMKIHIGKYTAYAAALLTAVSPGMIFYSRYAIHESTLYFFSLLTLYGIMDFRAYGDKRSLWKIALGFTGMLVTKETYILSIGAFSAALIAIWFYEKMSPNTDKIPSPPLRVTFTDIAQITGICIFIIVILYSGFFLNWKGLTGIPKSLLEWAKNGISHEHGQKGFWRPTIYWVQLFLRYEWAAFAGILLSFRLLAPSAYWQRVIGFYAIINLLVYSIIPYKTPWCIMQLIWPLLVTTASTFAFVAQRGGKIRYTATAFLILLSTLSAQQAIRLNFFHYVDDREPYVDVQTYKSVMEYNRVLQDLALNDPRKKHIPIEIIMRAYWPISWLIADFTKTAYYPESFPAKADAAVIFCDGDRQKALELKLKNSYFLEKFRLNPAQAESMVYFDRDLFKDYFEGKMPLFTPAPPETRQTGQGLTASYFSNAEWNGATVREETVGTVNLSFDNNDRPLAPPFGIIFDGQINIPADGEVTFYLASDDGSDLEINGKQLIDNSGVHVEKIKTVTQSFATGWYPLRVRFSDVGGAAVIRLWWKLPGRDQEMISPRYLKPLKAGEPQ